MLALALLAAVSLRFHFDASEFANAAYHVSCLTSRLSCTNPVFTKFWNEKYNVTREDGAELDAWRHIFEKIEGAAPLPPPAPFLPNYPGYFPSLRARNRVLAAAFESRSPDEFRRRALRLVAPEDAARLAAILEHFLRRLHPWWTETGRKSVETHLEQVKQRMRAGDMMPLARQMAAFMDAKLPGRDVYVHAIPGPDPVSKDATATFFANHFTVEILAADQPQDTVWKAMHEMTHMFYDAAPAARHLDLMGEFAATRHPAAQPLYGFLNEALATGLQLLIYERMGVKDDDPYHHPYIPRLGRSTMPLIKQALASRGTLFDGFAEPYIRAGDTELKQDAAKPDFILSVAAILATEKNRQASDAFFNEFQIRSFVDNDREWQQFPELNAVRLLTYDELPPFGAQLPDAANLTSHRGFAYIKRHASTGRLVLLAGQDTAAVVAVVKKLATLSSLPSEGLVFVLEQ